MAIKHFTLSENAVLSEEQRLMIKKTASLPVTTDEDNPELSEEQLDNFHRIHKSNQEERRRQNITLRLKPQTIRTAKSLGKGYTGILSRIIEDILENPSVLQKYL